MTVGTTGMTGHANQIKPAEEVSLREKRRPIGIILFAVVLVILLTVHCVYVLGIVPYHFF